MGATAWGVSDKAPGSDTSAWPAVFLAIGMLYAGFAPALINLEASHRGPLRHLVQAVAFHLAPVGAVAWFSATALDGSAYAHLSRWILGAYAACVLLTLGGFAWRLLRRQPPS